MNRDQFEAQWDQIKTYLMDRWNKLTDEDIRQINGRYDQLIAKLQQRYGYTSEEANNEVRNTNFDRYMKAQSSSYSEKEMASSSQEGSSVLPWVLVAAIPILLLAGYFANKSATNQEIAKPNVETQMQGQDQTQDITAIAHSPEDQRIVDRIREALVSNNINLDDLRNIRIDTTDGVVTLQGAVSSDETRDLIAKIIEKLNGVAQVDNQIQVSK